MMKLSSARIGTWFSLAAVVGLGVLAACSGNSRGSGFDDGTGADGGGGDGSDNNIFGGQGDAGPCHIKAGDTSDFDKDGYSAADGDSDDCNPNVNPGAFEVPGNGKDDDSDGEVDEVESCDDGLSMTSNDPYDGAKAMGLCKKVDPKATGKDKTWGILSAKYMWPDGSTSSLDMDGFGIRDKLGVNNPQEGKAMLALSSGNARNLSTHTKAKGGFSGRVHGPPSGYIVQEAPACAGKGVKTGPPQDGAALQIELRVPTNAKGFSYQQNFFTEEFPVYICSEFNDRFVTTLSPVPPGLPDTNNIAFDQDGNPISVNNSLLQVCSPRTAGGKDFKCPLGPNTLSGTTFESHAATGWLVTQAPAKPGDTITLTFAIWDSGDGALDSTVLLDKFEWSNDEKNTGTAPVPPK